MKCVNCGLENDDTETICAACGTTLNKDEGNVTVTTTEEVKKKGKDSLSTILIVGGSILILISLIIFIISVSSK